MPVSFYFDFFSPYSYLAHSQLATLGVPVRMVPVPVLELMMLVHNEPTSISCPSKGAYVRQDLARWAKRYQVGLRPFDMGKFDGGLALRVATAAEHFELQPQVVEAIFKGVWGGEGDVSPAGLGGYLFANGLPGAQLIASANEPSVHQALEDATDKAAEIGIFGVPTFLIDDELFFGNDRIDFVRAAIASRAERR